MTDLKLLLCDCRESQAIDAERLEDASGVSCSRVYSELCRAEAGIAEDAIRSGTAMIACGQEQSIFQEIAAEIEAEEPLFGAELVGLRHSLPRMPPRPPICFAAP